MPVGLYKIISDPKNKRANAYIMPNVDHRDGKRRIEPLEYLKQYRTTVLMVEEFSGLRFFTGLPSRERRVQTEQCVATMLH